jgi:ABC-type multidrug transport system ATPase subunit
LADRICVIEDGKVVELGSHDELIALDGRYRTMFDLQASRFTDSDEPEFDEHGEEVKYESLR